MRALCAAIITAGALIGVGLTALGLGIRYQNISVNGMPFYEMKFQDLDRPLQFCLVLLALTAIVGVGMTFVGLAYHHERRQREHELMAKGHPVHRAGV
jgi:hypothetical protein